MDAAECVFLHAAAQSLYATSPNISAHISRHLSQRLPTSHSQSPLLRREFCGSCGTVQIPGLTAKPLESIGHKNQTEEGGGGGGGREKRRYRQGRVRCLACLRITAHEGAKRPSRGAMMAAQRRSALAHFTVPTPPVADLGAPSTSIQKSQKIIVPSTTDGQKVNKTSTTNTSRKKARSKGLANLLAAKNEAAAAKRNTSTGLDLSDFMSIDH